LNLRDTNIKCKQALNKGNRRSTDAINRAKSGDRSHFS